MRTFKLTKHTNHPGAVLDFCRDIKVGEKFFLKLKVGKRWKIKKARLERLNIVFSFSDECPDKMEITFSKGENLFFMGEKDAAEDAQAPPSDHAPLA